jgi:hypothetical protein
MPEVIPASLSAIVALLKVAGAVPTRCTGGIWGTFSPDFVNSAPGLVVEMDSGEDFEEAPVQRVTVRVYCTGGANDDGSAASATYRIVAARLKAVQNEVTAYGRVMDCTQTSTEKIGEHEATGFMMSMSEWSCLVAAI